MARCLLKFTFFLLTFYFKKVENASECPPNLKFLCNEQKNCDECIQAHVCCHWCYDQTNITEVRCNFLEDLTQCEGKIEKNIKSSIDIMEDKMFTRIKRARDATKAIQIKPQRFKVVLRRDKTVNLTFTYKAARNYPLELYYLGDLSYSMRNHLEVLKNLGDELGRSLENLTLNYKLAYGSFLDKPGMPFFYTDEKNLNNPCQSDKEKCEKGYLFKHRLNFTKNTLHFFDQVKNSKISANVDDLDGALEAIQQIIVCNRRFGWTKESRKIIVLSTDSFLHTAGDGILAGAVLNNFNDLCLVDAKGDHMMPLKYDFPSVGQIKSLLKTYKVNLIIAVTKEKLNFYQTMEKHILDAEAFVGELKEDSTNILDLVSTGFYDFVKQVQFSSNTSHAPELDVKFFGDCFGNGHFNETSECNNVEEDKEMHFKLQLSLKEITSKTTEQILVREKSIIEDIRIDIEYAGNTCKCQNYELSGEEPSCSKNGVFNCGECRCLLGWIGDTCSEECSNDLKECRGDADSAITCSGRGDCLCSKCKCEFPYTGKYCNFACPVNKNHQICSGQGVCVEGVCNCNEGYDGHMCSCEKAIDGCKLTGTDSLCNGHGACFCNSCVCEEGFEGAYCEKTEEKNTFCNIYEEYVKDFAENGPTVFHRENVEILVEDLNGDCDDPCSIIYFSGAANRCSLEYCYHRGNNNSVHLGTKSKKCIYTNKAKAFGLGLIIFFSILIGGGILICLRKYQIYKLDEAEYKKFVDEQKNWNELNPLYKSPVTNFTNPMAR